MHPDLQLASTTVRNPAVQPSANFDWNLCVIRKIDGGGVQSIDRVGDIQARVLVDVKAPCRMDETLSEIGVEAPVPGLIGVGQGVA